jgi:DNA invertase Pin-like site-specific DNA recombinase
MKKVVIYARCATERQAELSLSKQIIACQEYAQQNGLLIVGVNIDRAKSGRKYLCRKAFRKTLKTAKRKECDAVLVSNTDRVSRDRKKMSVYAKELRENEVELLSARDAMLDPITDSLLAVFEEFDKSRRGRSE